ncbi:hypothetical protein BDB00DRAFT_463304 [Zychaea mexicana]|uniref:uncharacterized protein n=1 Tax=Zychaea mexicana TaxID=64656 RepID=UPI0022FE9BD7|nr:uncharacterized protein BDB00DRAFT_463304 [Zychaea mexicana]KAI9491952.1 hypothetical protein BDB00DRAFT_463304 [Zychaea mexicana]
MAPDLQFDQGIMKLSSFDPQSKRMETRVLCLPDLPRLESLEHLFTAAAAVSAGTTTTSNSSNRSRYAQVFAEPTASTSLRLTKSFTGSSKKSSSSMRGIPRRCFSNPSLSSRKNKESGSSGSSNSNSNNKSHIVPGTDRMMMMAGESWKSTGCRRSSSRRSLSHAIHAFTGLLQKAKRSSTLRNKQQWHNETWFVEMRMSTEELERPSKKKRVGTHTENWWASSPPICAC